MSGIFISYASEDRDRARILAHALEQRGWPVWWDREIPLGKAFDEVIEEELGHAQCVLVLWSTVSVESRWVRAEASAAAARGILIPVLLEEDVAIPLQFRLLHAADLSDWDGGTSHPEFRSLTAHIGNMLTSSPKTLTDTTQESTSSAATPTGLQGEETAAQVSAPKQAARQHKLRHALIFVLLPTVLIGAVALSLMNWRTSTRVEIDLVVDRMSFTIGGEQSVDIPVKPLRFRSLSIENFDRLRFTPERFVLDAGDERAVSSSLGSGEEFILEGATDRKPVLTITSEVSEARATGQLEQIALRPQSEVILEARSDADPRLTLRVFGQDLDVNVLPASNRSGNSAAPLPLGLSAIDATLAGIAGDAVAVDPDLRQVTLAPYAPYLTVEGARRDFAITALLDAAEAIQLGAQVPVGAVEFLEQDANGRSRTTLVAPGRLVYPDYPEIEAILLEADDSIEVGELVDAKLSRLMLDPQQGHLDLRLEGEAGRLEVNAGSDYRLTILDRLWHGPRTAVMFAILAWGFSVSIGAYKVYRDLTK